MCCAFCGGGNKWIKTCLARNGVRLRLCDPCYEALSRWFVVVSGDWVIAARCDSCGRYGNPREFLGSLSGGVRGPTRGRASCAWEADSGYYEEGVVLRRQVGPSVVWRERGASPGGDAQGVRGALRAAG